MLYPFSHNKFLNLYTPKALAKILASTYDFAVVMLINITITINKTQYS